MNKCYRVTVCALLAMAGNSFAQSNENVAPFIQAHAHNDYEHPRPLLDALDQGFCSVEADIYLVSGKLLVAHDPDKVRPDRTLESLYLDPLRERTKRNEGRVYPAGPEFTLLIDLKTDWHSTYPVLREKLEKYSQMLTTFENGTRKTGAVLAIISGDRSKQMFSGETTRYAAYDGELPDLAANDSPDLVPWISSNWRSSFSWRGEGDMPDVEKETLKSIVARAHQQGKKLRFWGSPDHEHFWKVLLAEGVDLINTDRLRDLRRFLASR